MTQTERMTEAEIPEIAPLAALFRVTLKALKGIDASPNDNEGASELKEYLDAGFPVFTVRKDGVYCGYMVCRVDEPCPVFWMFCVFFGECAHSSFPRRADRRAPEELVRPGMF